MECTPPGSNTQGYKTIEFKTKAILENRNPVLYKTNISPESNLKMVRGYNIKYFPIHRGARFHPGANKEDRVDDERDRNNNTRRNSKAFTDLQTYVIMVQLETADGILKVFQYMDMLHVPFNNHK